jgi:hypothetical protein
MPAARPHGQVVPDVTVLFEEIFEPLGQAQLAAAVEARGADGGDQDGHDSVGTSANVRNKPNPVGGGAPKFHQVFLGEAGRYTAGLIYRSG